MLALASRQKFGKTVEEIALSQLNELAEIKNDGNDLKLDDNAVVKWLKGKRFIHTFALSIMTSSPGQFFVHASKR